MEFEIVFIAVLVGLQIGVFISVYQKIKAYKNYFPESFKEIAIRKFSITKELFFEPQTFDKFLDSLSEEPIEIEQEEEKSVELLVISKSTGQKHKHFSEVLKSTNAYLCKNKGAAADFGILQDICDRHVEKVDNEIGNLINVPLYIGLGGTFIGIIIGLWGIDFSTTLDGSGAVISSDSISQLLNGVIAAMFASLFGLTCTVINSALVYKPAAFNNDTNKNHYYDFLQSELLPFLNMGISKTLGSFKDVLEHFIVKFGENMDDYKDSGTLLNENLQRQQSVLEEINKLSLTKTASKMVDVFSKLKDSSEHLEKFQNYQIGLNNYVDKTEKVAEEMNLIIDQFKDFNYNLKAIGNNTIANIELQKQFKSSLELHFPTIDDHRKVWRTHVDELTQDVKIVYTELNKYFKNSTEEIRHFIGNNSEFFNSLNAIPNAIHVFVENSGLQKDEFNILKNQIVDLRNDLKDSQRQSIETNIALIEAIKDLKITISRLKIPID